ncbi:MAG: hypothetical protein RSA50_00190, partial [Mucinivorans sp.]
MKIYITILLCLLSNSSMAQVKTGIEVLREHNFKELAGQRVGLITNPTGVDGQLKSTIDILNSPQARQAGVRLTA